MLRQLNYDDYISFKCHGIIHLIEKNKIRGILDEPRKPDKKCDPLEGIGQRRF